MAWRDLADFYHPTLDLPIAGKVYSIAAPDAQTGREFQDVMDILIAVRNGEDVPAHLRDRIVMDDREEHEFYSAMLGETLAEMLADGLNWMWVKHAGLTVFYWLTVSEEAAERWWVSVDPKAMTLPAPQDHKPKTTRKQTPKAKPASADGKTSPPPNKPPVSPGEVSSGTDA